MPPLGVELDERQKLACLHRILAGIGFNENMAGHVTMAADGADDLWASPWGLWWDEVRASDLVPGEPRRRGARGPLGREPGDLPAHRHPPRSAPTRA